MGRPKKYKTEEERKEAQRLSKNKSNEKSRRVKGMKPHKKYVTEEERLLAKKLIKKKWNKNNPDKVKEMSKKWKETNPEKKKEINNKWAKANPDKVRNTRLKTKYNITIEDYNQMFDNQKGCCAICNTHQSELKKILYVDHNHDTGEVRGLLCHICNSILGYAKDNTEILNNAIKYLNRCG